MEKDKKGGDPHKRKTCGKEFRDATVLNSHIPSHQSARVYKGPLVCPYCDQVFTRLFNMRSHINGHTGEKPYKCPDCDEAFTHSSKLKLHSYKHKGKNPNQCHICGKHFRDKTGLQAHLLVHTGIKPHVCLECGKRFTQAPALKAHTLAHEGKRPHICPQCRKGYATRQMLKAHILNIHVGKKRHKCPQCEKEFLNICHLRSHIRMHTGEKPYICQYCGKGFSEKHSLKEHIYTHTGEMPHKCPHCSKGFPTTTRLKRHMNNEKFHCRICNAEWKCKGALETHMQTHKGHECLQCEKTFGCASELKRHMLTHKGGKPATKVKRSTCHLRPKKMDSTNVLKCHTNILEEKKVCVCPSLDPGIKIESDLKSYIKDDANEDHPYILCRCEKLQYQNNFFRLRNSTRMCSSCSLCVGGFFNKDTLKSHLISHLKGVPYVCSHCSRKFREESDLSSHMLRAHEVETRSSKCFFCVRGFMKLNDLKLHLESHK